MGFPAKCYPDRRCINPACGKTFNRKRRSDGTLEPSRHYLRRVYCDTVCRRHDMKPAEEIIPTRRQRELIEDVGWIIGHDSIVSVANRVGYKSPVPLERMLHKAGAHQLAGRVREEYQHYLDAALVDA